MASSDCLINPGGPLFSLNSKFVLQMRPRLYIYISRVYPRIDVETWKIYFQECKKPFPIPVIRHEKGF